jgi:hypothetical protein
VGPPAGITGKGSHGTTVAVDQELRKGGAMAKYHARPSAQYRYEHYDPR